MSRNLTSSTCVDCGKHTFKLEDMRGKPIEFHGYSNMPPVIGCKCACPDCGTVYFLWWREATWNMPSQHNNFEGNYTGFVIDLAYYESFNDEHGYDGEAMRIELGLPDGAGYWEIRELWDKTFPGRGWLLYSMEDVGSLVKDNREDQQWVW